MHESMTDQSFPPVLPASEMRAAEASGQAPRAGAGATSGITPGANAAATPVATGAAPGIEIQAAAYGEACAGPCAASRIEGRPDTAPLAAIHAAPLAATCKATNDALHAQARTAQQVQPAAPSQAPASRLRSTAFTPHHAHCAQHGPYPLNTVDADGTERWHGGACPACTRVRRAEALMRRAAIAPRFSHCRFENYIAVTPMQQLALDECRRYAEEFEARLAAGTSLVLRGLPGTGKNHLACAIAHHLIARGRSVLNATAHEIVERIRDTWRRANHSLHADFSSHAGTGADSQTGAGNPAGHAYPNGPRTESAVIEEFAVLDLLIIDEVGRGHRSREGTEPVELFNVIDARYRRVRPTIILSNLPLREIRNTLGLAAFDRLREGGGSVLNFEWTSSRAHVTPPAQRMSAPTAHHGPGAPV